LVNTETTKKPCEQLYIYKIMYLKYV